MTDEYPRQLEEIGTDMARAMKEGQPEHRIDALIDEWNRHPEVVATQAEHDAADAVCDEVDRQGFPPLRLAD